MLVSIIIPVCNQGDEARRTVVSAHGAMASVPHEIILVDDQSIDGSCHGFGKNVLIVRTRCRAGVSSARRLGFRHARGDLLIWSDAHCRFGPGSLQRLVEAASRTDGVVMPTIIGQTGGERRYGGAFVMTRKGLRIAEQTDLPARHPALFGSIYGVSRRVYEFLGGWPKLPGVWGGSEEALSLMCWFLGVPILIDSLHTCAHFRYRIGKARRRFPFSVSLRDRAQNAHYLHAAFFPRTYDTYWRPILESYFGEDDEFLAPLKSSYFRRLRLQLEQLAIRDEEEFFEKVLAIAPPDTHDDREWRQPPPTPEEGTNVW